MAFYLNPNTISNKNYTSYIILYVLFKYKDIFHFRKLLHPNKKTYRLYLLSIESIGLLNIIYLNALQPLRYYEVTS